MQCKTKNAYYVEFLWLNIQSMLAQRATVLLWLSCKSMIDGFENDSLQSIKVCNYQVQFNDSPIFIKSDKVSPH